MTLPGGQAGTASIEDLGLIGDSRTAGLVTSGGDLDWLCVPRFDGPPLFGRLVGGPEAGSFGVAPAGPARVVARRYLAHTATIETTWETAGGRLVLADAMVAEVAGRLLPSTLLVRRVTAERGAVDAEIRFDPRLGERHRRPRWRRQGPHLVCHWGTLAVSVRCSSGIELAVGRSVTVPMRPGQPVTLVLAVADREPLVLVDPAAAVELVTEDERRWQAWADEVDGAVPYRDAVVRSLLTLRLLTYSPSGAPVAAPTTSLPEAIGGERNWDYRYAWPRDASIGVGAFTGVGKHAEARAFLAWLLHASRLDRPRLPVLLDLDGRQPPPERRLAGWPGYRGSAPVRFGNGAADQHQLDGYGWVLDAAWVREQAGHRLDGETWRAMRAFADLVARRWAEPDAGIWEIRDDAAHHVHSKLMGWLALDRALRLARSHPARRAQRSRWATARDAIAHEVADKGVDPIRCTYTRSYGSAELDAALLIVPLLGLHAEPSPLTTGTIDAIRSELGAGGPLLYRYPPGRDGLPGREGAFLACSFWLVQALAATGQVADARAVFESLLELASPLGLFAEEVDPATGAYLGNHPQALTHASLVQAALAIRDAEQPPARPR